MMAISAKICRGRGIAFFPRGDRENCQIRRGNPSTHGIFHVTSLLEFRAEQVSFTLGERKEGYLGFFTSRSPSRGVEHRHYQPYTSTLDHAVVDQSHWVLHAQAGGKEQHARMTRCQPGNPDTCPGGDGSGLV